MIKRAWSYLCLPLVIALISPLLVSFTLSGTKTGRVLVAALPSVKGKDFQPGPTGQEMVATIDNVAVTGIVPVSHEVYLEKTKNGVRIVSPKGVSIPVEFFRQGALQPFAKYFSKDGVFIGGDGNVLGSLMGEIRLALSKTTLKKQSPG